MSKRKNSLSLDPERKERGREQTEVGHRRHPMPLNRQLLLLRKVQALFSRLGKGSNAAEEEAAAVAMMIRWASNASAATSTATTFASSPIASSVQRSPPIVASFSWHDRSDRVNLLTRERGVSSLPGGGIAAPYSRRSVFTRAAPLPLPAVAAGGSGGGERRRKGSSSDRRRRSSSSSSSSPSSRSKRRILPSEMPRLPQVSRRGQRQWRTLLEDEVSKKVFFLPSLSLDLLCLQVLTLFPLSPKHNPAKRDSTLSARMTSRRRSARS